jgi:DNA-binding response OmpR family regulator
MNILFIEGNPKNVEIVKNCLGNPKYKVHFVANQVAGLYEAQNPDFNVIIIDLEPAHGDGVKLLNDIRDKGIQTPVLVLSPQQKLEQMLPFLEKAENEFLVKPITDVEFKVRLKTLFRRTRDKMDRSRLQKADVILDLQTREAYREEKKISLQKNEFELLEFLMRNSGKVITKAQILQKVWDYNFDPQTNVVDVLVWRLREKIDKHFSTKVIQTVRGVGYIFKIT